MPTRKKRREPPNIINFLFPRVFKVGLSSAVHGHCCYGEKVFSMKTGPQNDGDYMRLLLFMTSTLVNGQPWDEWSCCPGEE